jgi:hypothetical protein
MLAIIINQVYVLNVVLELQEQLLILWAALVRILIMFGLLQRMFVRAQQVQ